MPTSSKYTLIIISVLQLSFVILTGCGLKSDFSPPEGRAVGPSGATDEGPWTNRLMFAVSDDGIVFERTGQIFSDQAAVPDLIFGQDGKLYLYYVGWSVGDLENKTVVGVSKDNGNTWTYHYLVLNGFEDMPSPVDPDINILGDGTFRLYFTSANRGDKEAHTFVAEGRDGINFTNLGAAIEVSDESVLDPDAFYLDGLWHLFAGGIPAKNWHATSEDGLSYTLQGLEEFTAPSDHLIYTKDSGYQRIDGPDTDAFMLANATLIDDETVRMYGFSTDGSSIWSWDTKDGLTWTSNGEALSTLDSNSTIESGVTSDASVVKLPDGTFLMVYTTSIPRD